MELVQSALAAYGVSLGLQGVIVRNEKATGVQVVVKRGRIRFESTGSGRLLASGPVSAATVEKFVESFWFWKKV